MGNLIQSLISLLSLIITFLIFFLIIRAIWRTFKKFLFELIDRANGTAPRSDAGQQNYTYTYNAGKPNYTNEARKAYEDITKKRKQEEKPPWEE